jgi:glycosyltransferase involved in cell wall biosynthesis
MKRQRPLTIALRAHNAKDTITETIISTLNQSYNDFEIWVLENGSTDRTAEVARRIPDTRIKVFELGPVGQTGAMQYAIEHSKSDWIALMDADDLMFPERLRRQMAIIRERPDLVMVGTGFALLTPFGHIFENRSRSVGSVKEVTKSSLSRGRIFHDGSVIFRRGAALEVGGIDGEFTYADLPLFFRLLSRGRAYEISEPLYLYRLVNPQSLSTTASFPDETWRIRVKYAPDTLHIWPRATASSSRWYYVNVLELLAGEGKAVRQAAAFLDAEAPRAAQRMRRLSYSGKVGRLLYRWTHPEIPVFKRREDWEELFGPLLKIEVGSRVNGYKYPSRGNRKAAELV